MALVGFCNGNVSDFTKENWDLPSGELT
jgi:hypothetical protein